MEGTSETESDAGLLHTPGDSRTIEFDRHSERFEQIERTRGGRGSPVAMLDDPGAGAGGHETRHCGDVERMHPATRSSTGADDVDRIRTGREFDGLGAGHHGLHEAGDLPDRLTLHAQGHDECGDLGVAGVAVK